MWYLIVARYSTEVKNRELRSEDVSGTDRKQVSWSQDVRQMCGVCQAELRELARKMDEMNGVCDRTRYSGMYRERKRQGCEARTHQPGSRHPLTQPPVC